MNTMYFPYLSQCSYHSLRIVDLKIYQIIYEKWPENAKSKVQTASYVVRNNPEHWLGYINPSVP